MSNQQYEITTDHPDELQIWATWSSPHRPILGWLFSFGIRLFTGKYSHLMLRKGNHLWSAGRKGVEDLDIHTFNEPHIFVDAYRIPTTSAIDDLVVTQAASYVGTPYDVMNILKERNLLYQIGLDDYAWIVPDDGDAKLTCSELVSHSYAAGGINLPAYASVPFWAFAPSHIRRVSVAKYRGRVVFWKNKNRAG